MRGKRYKLVAGLAAAAVVSAAAAGCVDAGRLMGLGLGQQTRQEQGPGDNNRQLAPKSQNQEQGQGNNNEQQGPASKKIVAGGDVNDVWTFRLLVIGGFVVSGLFLVLLFRRKNKRDCLDQLVAARELRT